MFTITQTSNITAFLTNDGIDVVARNEADANAVSTRTRLSYEELAGEINGLPVAISFTDADDELVCCIGDHVVTLKLQAKGHFFSFVLPLPKSTPISLAEARKRIAS